MHLKLESVLSVIQCFAYIAEYSRTASVYKYEKIASNGNNYWNLIIVNITSKLYLILKIDVLDFISYNIKFYFSIKFSNYIL